MFQDILENNHCISVSSLDLHPKLITALLKANIGSTSKLFSFTKFEVEKKTGISESEVNEVYNVASLATVTNKSFTTAFQIYQKNDNHFKLHTGCPSLDHILNGGFLYPGITEISGESASGKTQLCIQVCLNVQHADDHKVGSIYICTEDAFPVKRLHQMSISFFNRNYKKLELKHYSEVTDKIFIEHTADLEDLLALLTVRLPVILKNQKIKLVVLDSIAALFRVEFNSWEMAERAKMLAKVGSLLHKISYQYKVCIICVNQVSDVIRSDNPSRKVIPALGLTWSYYVTTRIMLSRTQWKASMFTKFPLQSQLDPVVRCFSILFAPHLPSASSNFIVDEDGVKEFNIPVK